MDIESTFEEQQEGWCGGSSRSIAQRIQTTSKKSSCQAAHGVEHNRNIQSTLVMFAFIPISILSDTHCHHSFVFVAQCTLCLILRHVHSSHYISPTPLSVVLQVVIIINSTSHVTNLAKVQVDHLVRPDYLVLFPPTSCLTCLLRRKMSWWGIPMSCPSMMVQATSTVCWLTCALYGLYLWTGPTCSLTGTFSLSTIIHSVMQSSNSQLAWQPLPSLAWETTSNNGSKS